MATLVTIEQLAERLGGNLWTKDDLKRIYLDRGHNTKKMKTKCYIFQSDNGTFGVSVYIECPSQHPSWIESQRQEVKDGIWQEIERAELILNTQLVEFKASEKVEGDHDVLIKIGDEEAKWLNEDEFYDKFGNYPYAIFSQIPAPQPTQIVVAKPIEDKQLVQSATEATGVKIEVGKQYKHGKFGIGTVESIEMGGKVAKINFGGTVKTLMTAFVKLEAVND